MPRESAPRFHERSPSGRRARRPRRVGPGSPPAPPSCGRRNRRPRCAGSRGEVVATEAGQDGARRPAQGSSRRSGAEPAASPASSGTGQGEREAVPRPAPPLSAARTAPGPSRPCDNRRRNAERWPARADTLDGHELPRHGHHDLPGTLRPEPRHGDDHGDREDRDLIRNRTGSGPADRRRGAARADHDARRHGGIAGDARPPS